MKHYLPIGSIVLLRGATKKIMITGYQPINNGKTWDYSGVLFPEGLQNSNGFVMFQAADISSIFLIGFQDGEGMSFLDRLDKSVF